MDFRTDIVGHWGGEAILKKLKFYYQCIFPLPDTNNPNPNHQNETPKKFCMTLTTSLLCSPEVDKLK